MRHLVPPGLRMAILALLTGTLASYLMFYLVRKNEYEHIQTEFRYTAENLMILIGDEIDADLEALQSLAAFYDASSFVNRQEFRTYASGTLQRHKSIQALEWIPRIPLKQRVKYEQQAQEIYPHFELKELSSESEMVSAGERPEYYPVYYVEPYQDNKSALGFDLYSSNARREALQKSARSYQATATARIKLVQETSNQYGFLVFYPIYKNQSEAAPSIKTLKTLHGFVLAVFRIGDMISKPAQFSIKEGIHIYVFDETDPKDRQFLSYIPHNTHRHEDLSETFDHDVISKGLHSKKIKKVADRTWSIFFTPDPIFLEEQRSWFAWVVLFFLLILTLLLTFYLRSIQKRTIYIETVVEARTAELAESRRMAIAASQAKSAFLTNMSHELRTPMNTVIGYAHCLLEGLDGPVNERQRESLARITRAGAHLLELINASLDLSKIEAGKLELFVEETDIVEIVQSCVFSFESATKVKRLGLSANYEQERILLSIDSVKIRQVIINLIGNAIKFTDTGEIRIRVRLDQGFVWVSVADSGIGMTNREMIRIFDAFSQVDHSITRKYEGSGLGLAISRRLVELHGGSISVQSQKGHGSVFTFSIPVYSEESL